MNYVLFDDQFRDRLLPLVFMCPTSSLRIGALTIQEKWEKHLDSKFSFLTQNYLKELFPLIPGNEYLLINGKVCPDEQILSEICNLNLNEKLFYNDNMLALRIKESDLNSLLQKGTPLELADVKKLDSQYHPNVINHCRDIFRLVGEEIIKDYNLLAPELQNSENSSTNTYFGKQIFVSSSAKIRCSVLNAEKGPIFIGDHVEIMEHCVIHGPVTIGDESVLKIGTKIYGPTSIGPSCKIGGEVTNSVFMGFSNKGHDGFVGNSVIGKWCNLGADTNTSNLKNNYSNVKVWNYRHESFEDSNTQFCGLTMGDHSKSSINTMFNTGTVVGACSNIFGYGFPPKFIPSFSWCNSGEITDMDFSKSCEIAEKVMERRNLKLSEDDRKIMKIVMNHDHKFRNKK